VESLLASHRPRWPYEEAAEAITREAEKDGEHNARFDRYNIRAWLLGSLPRRKNWKWIARAWNLTIEDIAAAIDEHLTWRSRQLHAPDAPPVQLVAPTPQSAEAPSQLITPPAILTPPSTVLRPNEALPYPLTEDTYPMMRRQFLQQLLSISATALVPNVPAYVRTNGPPVPVDPDVFLQECESNIRACWRLMQGRDMVVVPSVLTSWLPLLDSLLRDSSAHRRELAALAAEGYMLGGLVTVLQGHLDRAEWFCQQAVDYADIAGHPDLTVAALKHLATKYLDARFPVLTLRTYERAIQHLDSASPLSRGRTYLGLALANAQVGNNSDAERHLALAHDNFPDHPEHDPAFPYTDARRASLHHYGGLIHLLAGRPRQAWDTWAEVVRDPAATHVPERTLIELINCQAEAAIALGDVELAASHVETSVQGARNLQSAKRYRDSLNLYSQLHARWPTDPRVKRLEPLFAPNDLTHLKQ
jgi:tetratricopeptide (TPR) repeat protein